MKKPFKPLVILLMSFILCIPMLATSVFGTEATEIAPAEHEIQGSLRIDEPIVLPYSAPDLPEISYYGTIAPASEVDTLFAMEELMKEALLNGETTVDLEPYNISRDRINLTLSYVFSPYISGNIEVAVYVYSNGTYAYMTLDNPMTVEETAEYFDEVDEKVVQLRALVAGGKTEAEKCLILHDYFAYNAEYDYDNYLSGTIPEDSYRSCGIMMENIGVCQSYAYAYMYILTLEGIECHVTTSDSMNHAWNIVNVDGEYYQVDVTWDDPTRDKLGRVNHNYFLVSDDAFVNGRASLGISMNSHTGWNSASPKCTSTRFDDAYWANVSSNIVTYGDYSYYVEGREIIKRSNANGSMSKLVDLGKWYVWGSNARYYTSAYSGIVLISGDLYYNTATEIRKINLDTFEDSVFYTPDVSSGYIYGAAVSETLLKYEISKDPGDRGTIFSVEVELTPAPSVKLDHDDISLNEGETFTLTASGVSENLEWTTSDPTVATVDGNGIVTAVSAGNAVITVTADGGSSASCNVTVTHTHKYGAWFVTTYPGCTTEGEERRDCTCGDFETKTVESLGHDEVQHSAKTPTCTEFGWNAYVTCTRCDYTTYVLVPENGHTASPAVVENNIPATCTADGSYDSVVYCTVCSAEISRTEKTVTAEGHKHVGKVTAPTCTEQGYTTYTCSCGESYVDDYVKENGHTNGTPVKENEVPAKCTADGSYDSVVYCTVCSAEISRTASVIPAEGHTEVTDAAVDAKCDVPGLTEGVHCSVCSEVLTAQQITEVLGHDFSPEWTVDIEPTTTTLGQKSRHCSRCDEVTDVIEIAKMVEVTDTSKKFTDVTASSWAKPGIDYVVSYGYMNGTGNGTTFSPGGTMSRSMIVTVLYRIAGQPSHSGVNPFTDITTGWYYDAVIWAYENGIVTGTSKTTFAPDGAVTREQMATFLYRFAGYMGYDVTKTNDISTFPDSSKVGSWAYNALAWANAEGLITGAVVGGETVLNPQGAATREQVATILMRFCKAFAE